MVDRDVLIQRRHHGVWSKRSHSLAKVRILAIWAYYAPTVTMSCSMYFDSGGHS